MPLFPHAMLFVKGKMRFLSLQREWPQSFSIFKISLHAILIQDDHHFLMFLRSGNESVPSHYCSWKNWDQISDYECGATKDCLKVAEETVKCKRGDLGLWGFMGSVDKNCSRKESVKGLLLEIRGHTIVRYQTTGEKLVKWYKPKVIRKIHHYISKAVSCWVVESSKAKQAVSQVALQKCLGRLAMFDRFSFCGRVHLLRKNNISLFIYIFTMSVFIDFSKEINRPGANQIFYHDLLISERILPHFTCCFGLYFLSLTFH